MAVYLRLFDTELQYNNARSNDYYEPWTSLVLENSGVSFNKSEEEKLLATPLTFEITSDGNIRWKTSSTAGTRTIEYKKNDGEWTSITSTTGDSASSISVVSGDTVQFRGNNSSYSNVSYTISFSASTAGFKLSGNIMSLIKSSGFEMENTLSSGRTFLGLFRACTGLTDASQLILPATTLADSCYRDMFGGCTSLTTAPELPATILANYCYHQMFIRCTSLTTAPELPATTLANYCYNEMFRACSKLNYIKCLATSVSATNCKSNWVYGVASSGTFVKSPNITESTWGRSNSGIPSNWTVQDA